MALRLLTPGWLLGCGIAVAAGLTGIWASDKTIPASDKTAMAGWDFRAAARYLDGREDWWKGWDHAKRDHGTQCVSCHTQAPYALARPALRSALGERDISDEEKAMLAGVEKRVQNWDEMLPFYSDEKYGAGKERESRNAESVLNAVILSSYDAQRGRQSELTRLAFEHAWELQSRSGADAGAWVWQNFSYAPWESKESEYHWAALIAVAVGKEPASYAEKRSLLPAGRESAPYAADPLVSPHVKALLGYLRDHYQEQPILNKVVALWVEAYFPGTVTPQQERELMAELDRLQHEDGGWSTSDLGNWQRRDGTPLDKRSDGYATGLIVLVREERDREASRIPQVARGLGWLVANQNRATGSWPAWSLNKDRKPDSDPYLFMTDAATAYAILALERSSVRAH